MSVLNPTPAQAEGAPEAAVIKAETVEAQALAFTATINALPTVAGVWDLNETRDEVPSSTTFIPHKNPGQESVMEGDGRTPVDPKEFAVGGKYRSILKLFINYENLPNNSYAHGTGWLIRPDLMVTAGHNVYSWRRTNGRLPGRAREIKAYAGYNGAKSISDGSVEFRRATRVVTTSQWLDSASSRPRDFALVQFDRPFTDVTPFQYIETPAMADLQLGVVGYPADLKDQETGERGGKMYELFEQTKFDITANPDRMLAHYIDSEGGNSGGPVLRGNDLVALGTHVYGGGDFNTASVLGRYGNPIQDYIGALEVPLASPGQINMVTVGSAYVHQDNAATGPQTKEIAKLGVNVVAQPSGNGTAKPEFWIFEGAEEVFKLATDLAGSLGGPIAGVVGTAIAPIIAQGLAEANKLDVDAILQRFVLANKTLLTAESKFQEERFFDDLAGAVTGALKIVPIGGPVIGLPFQEIMKGINVVGSAADKLVNDVANEIARGLLIRAQSLQMQARAESAMDVDGKQGASANEKAFLEELARAAKAHKSAGSGGAQPEGWFDDAINGIKGAAGTVVDIGSSVVDTAINVGTNVGNAVDNVGNRIANGVADVASGVIDDIGNGINGVAGNLHNGVNQIIGDVTGARRPEGFFDDVLDIGKKAIDFANPALSIALLPISVVNPVFGAALGTVLPALLQAAKAESAFENVQDKAAAVFDDLRRVAQAIILHNVLADKYFATQMARPVPELKAEGFFDDLFKTPGSITTTVGVGMIGAAGVSTAVPVVGMVAAVPLFVGGYLTALAGQVLD